MTSLRALNVCNVIYLSCARCEALLPQGYLAYYISDSVDHVNLGWRGDALCGEVRKWREDNGVVCLQEPSGKPSDLCGNANFPRHVGFQSRGNLEGSGLYLGWEWLSRHCFGTTRGFTLQLG